MRCFWLEATPYDRVAGAGVTVRATSVSLAAAALINGAPAFLDVLADGPTISNQVFDGSFTGRVTSTFGSIPLTAGQGDIDFWAALAWSDRSVKIWTGEIGQDGSVPAWGSLTLIFEGVAESFKPGIMTATIQLRVRRPSGKLAGESYAGTGGVEGRAEIKGAVKPYAAGLLLNRPATLLDSAKGLYQVHGYGAVQALTTIREGYNVLDQTRVAQASEAALLAATVPATEIHTHLASGLFRIGFSPIADISCDFSGANSGGFSARPGALIARMLAQAGWAGGVDTGSLAAIDAALPYDCSIYDDQGADIADKLDEFLRDIGGYWDVTELGTFYAGLVATQSPSLTIGMPGAFKDVDLYDLDQLATQAPFWRNKVGYAFNPRTFSAAELGVATASTTADWSGVRDDGGKPDDNADVTGSNTAAAIVGQGALALKNTADYSTDIVGTHKPITYRIRTRGLNGALQGGDTHVGLWNETTQTQIAGFGLMYSVCHLPPGSSTWEVDVFDPLNNPTTYRAFLGTTAADRDAMQFRLNQICDAYRTCPIVIFTFDEPMNGRLTAGIDTAMYRCGASRAVFGSARFPYRAAYVLIGQANALEGNGAEYLAGVGDNTKAQIDITFGIVNGIVGIAGVTPSDARDLVYAGGISIESLKPFQVDSDRTILNTAAALAGQGALATANVADWPTQVTGTGKPVNYADVTGTNIAAGFTGQGALAGLNTVTTGEIAPGAVTSTTSAFTAGSIGISSVFFTTVQSVSVTAAAGDIVDIIANCSAEFTGGSNTSIRCRLSRNGTAIFDTVAWTPQYVSPAFSDTPGAGTHTYDFEIAMVGALCSADITNRYLRGLVVKR